MESGNPLSNGVTDGARLTDRPQGTGEPFGSRAPPAVELVDVLPKGCGHKKCASIGRWAHVRLVIAGCQTRLPIVRQRDKCAAARRARQGCELCFSWGRGWRASVAGAIEARAHTLNVPDVERGGVYLSADRASPRPRHQPRLPPAPSIAEWFGWKRARDRV